MTLFLTTLVFFALTFGALGLKLMFGRPGIKGSCGGHVGLDQKLSCTGCSCSGDTDRKAVKAVTLLR